MTDMIKYLIGCALVIFAWMPISGLADSGADVVVVYNKRLPESKIVAEHYAQVRHVPEQQIYGFDLTTNEEISRLEFRDSLQLSLARKLEADGFWKFETEFFRGKGDQPDRAVRKVVASTIRYAVLCYGVPLKIASDPALHEAAAEKMRPELQRNEASVDSELVWLPFLRTDLPLTGPLQNWVYGVTNTHWIDPTNGILMVARLDGPTMEIANHLVDKAMQAERDGFWGRAYFDARGLEKTNEYYVGDQWILGAAEMARRLGFETVVDTNAATFPASFPMSQIAIYCGWYDYAFSGPFRVPKVEFMPGAFAYHLQSSSAASIRTSNDYWVGPLLAKGATITMGSVNEPYLTGTPNVAAFMEFLGSGYTFGEAAWAAQSSLSWQTTVIGDPLYRPFGKTPQLLHAQLMREHSPFLEWSYLRLANLGLVHGVNPAQVSTLLENLDATTNSAVLSEKLADLYAAQGKPSSAIETYQRALKLNPSPQQQIQIRLTLGQKLLDQNRKAGAIADYRELLRESPDYPGRNSVEDKIHSLEFPGTDAPVKP